MRHIPLFGVRFSRVLLEGTDVYLSGVTDVHLRLLIFVIFDGVYGLFYFTTAILFDFGEV
jgi:hypothetical protein